MSWARERRGVRKAEVGKERVGEGKERGEELYERQRSKRRERRRSSSECMD